MSSEPIEQKGWKIPSLGLLFRKIEDTEVITLKTRFSGKKKSVDGSVIKTEMVGPA